MTTLSTYSDEKQRAITCAAQAESGGEAAQPTQPASPDARPEDKPRGEPAKPTDKPLPDLPDPAEVGEDG